MSFHLYDYLILGAMFLISFVIGMYYAYVGRGIKSTKEYFTAGGNIGVIPATISLLASILCSIWYVGIPLEVYSFGIHFMMDVPAIIFSLVVSGYAFLPVFHELQVASSTEYLERRFNKSIRLSGAVLYIINSAFYVSLVMFIPAMAISQVMGIHIWISILSMCIVGTAYTALGGIRAVIWTDVFQTLIIYTSLLAIAIKGTMDVGGIGVIWDRGVKGERIAVAPVSVDPRYRYSLFWLFLTETVYFVGFYGTYQTQIQRYVSCPSVKAAQKALFINIPALIFVEVLIIYIGLVLYATFASCDPLLNNEISHSDELLTYFVLKTFKGMPGMAGLFVAGIFSGALSTISSCLNSMAAVTIEDFVVLIPRFKLTTDETKTCMARWIATLYGLLTLILMILVEKVESIISFWAYNNGAVNGISMGLFILGLFCPWVNSRGAASGLIASVIFGVVVAVGGQISSVDFEPAPMSTESCIDHNLTFTNGNTAQVLASNKSSHPILYAKELENNGGIYELFKISPMVVQIFSFLISMVVGMTCSRLFGCSETQISDIKLFSPVIRKWVKNRWLDKENNNVILVKILYVDQKQEKINASTVPMLEQEEVEESSFLIHSDITNVCNKEALNYPNGTI